jgi:hypothetical protein
VLLPVVVVAPPGQLRLEVLTSHTASVLIKYERRRLHCAASASGTNSDSESDRTQAGKLLVLLVVLVAGFDVASTASGSGA